MEDHVKEAISNLLHKNIDVRSGSIIAKFPGYRVKFISNLQYHCANTTFDDKIRYDRRESEMN